METIICNTGPIIALSGINQLAILQDIFTRIIVPDSVHQEILRGGKYFSGLKVYQQTKWIEIMHIQQPVDPLLLTILDDGEATVIHLARELNLKKILMDERKGRRIARDAYGLTTIGTVGVMVEAKKMGFLPEIGNLFLEMRKNGYWIHDRIIQAALQKAGES